MKTIFTASDPDSSNNILPSMVEFHWSSFPSNQHTAAQHSEESLLISYTTWKIISSSEVNLDAVVSWWNIQIWLKCKFSMGVNLQSILQLPLTNFIYKLHNVQRENTIYTQTYIYTYITVKIQWQLVPNFQLCKHLMKAALNKWNWRYYMVNWSGRVVCSPKILPPTSGKLSLPGSGVTIP